MQADRRRFRSAFLPVWRVTTTWCAAIAGGIFGLQALTTGVPPVPQLLLSVGAAVACGVLFAAAIHYYRVEVSAEGLGCYDLLGRYAVARWEAIIEVRPTGFLGLRYLRVYAEDTRWPRWLPLFLADATGFAEAVAQRAGLDHPLTRALPREASWTRRSDGQAFLGDEPH